MSPQNYRAHQHCDTNMCWKCLKLTFSSDLEKPCFKLVKACLQSNINAVPEEIQLIYIRSKQNEKHPCSYRFHISPMDSNSIVSDFDPFMV